MNNTINYMSDTELVSKYQSTSDNTILEILLQKHSQLIKTVAKKHFQKHKRIDFEDVLQNAQLAAIQAIQKFDISKNIKLSTYLYFKISKILLTCDDEQNFISCPAHMREVRSYIAGKYDFDNLKKKNFERKYSIYNIDDLNDLKQNNCLLKNNSVCVAPDEILPEQEYSNENDCVDLINASLFINSLPEDEKKIAHLLIEGFSRSKISEMFDDISSKQIHTKVNAIKEKFVKHYYG